MSLEFRAVITESAPIIDILQVLVLEGSQKTQFLDELGAALVEGARLRFGEQVTPQGQPWMQSYRAREQGGQTLRDTDRLMDSLTHEVAGDSVFYGTNVEYAAPLHYGAHIKPTAGAYLKFKGAGGRFAQKKEVFLPPREFLGISSDDEQSILEIIQNFLGQKL